MTAVSKKKIKRCVGDVVRIPLRNKRLAYGHLLKAPLMGIYRGVFESELTLTQIRNLAVAFRIWVVSDVVEKGTWPVVGQLPLSELEQEEPFFFKQDPIDGRLSLYHSSLATNGYERPATLLECEGLECAAIWDVPHVVDRIEDAASGRENEWLKSLQIDQSRIPLDLR